MIHNDEPGEQNDSAGRLWCAIANTEWGRIPGKAKNGECWFPFGGQEHVTQDFVRVSYYVFSKECDSFPQGDQNDGAGALWCAVANTEWGRIPGKAQNGQCWFPYGGEEHCTDNFDYVLSHQETLNQHQPNQNTMSDQAPGFQNDGAGHLWCAVANTEWGRIPGKAKEGQCWFPYGGEERCTRDYTIIRRHCLSRQPDNFPQGDQTDGAGALWCAVANTQWGRIPGKAKEGQCWFPYGGEERCTEDFDYVLSHEESLQGQQWNSNQVREGPTGNQTDGAGELWCGIANTEWGQIPGKCKGDECWFPYGGEEHCTQDFRVVKRWRISRHNNGKPSGDQTDGAGALWCAIANTEWGWIPGKAKGNECWFPYGGEEHCTQDFKFVLEHDDFQEGPSGNQTDGAGELWCGVANTEWGQIPGKCKGDECWFPYGGEEHSTGDFRVIQRWRLSQQQEGPPAGEQTDGAGALWCAVANTEWGRIPGKAQNGKCWFPYGGQERETHDFDYVIIE